MEKHKCKLCSRSFANGRSLGGHMKAHLATLPLPPKPPPSPSPSSSYSFSQEHDNESDEKALIYELRENPKKSIKLADPEFSFVDTGSVVQDRESETESKNPTRLRSKRTRTQRPQPKKPKPAFNHPPLDPEPLSSVSDTYTEEDVAMCLMMLSRDKWKRSLVKQDQEQEESKGFEEIKVKGVRGRHQCDKCNKRFRSFRAVGSHRNICFRDQHEAPSAGNDKIFECPFCGKVFGSGQALGGHKRSHLVPSSSSNANDSGRLKESLIDLNLPAMAEEDELSVVSDA